jgi:hypothetical protein
MVMRYLGSTVNVVASGLGLVALIVCVLTGLGWLTIPIVIGVYVLAALVARLVLPKRPEPEQHDHPTAKPRRAAPG